MATEVKEDIQSRFLITLACIVIIIAGMREASSILVPFLLSVFIAVMCGVPFAWMRGKRIPTFLAISIIIVGIFGLAFGLGAYIASSANDFFQQLPLYQKRIHILTIMIIKWLRTFHIYISERMILQYFDPGSIMNIIANLLSGLGSALTYSFLILFTVVFILIEASNYSKKISLNCFPDQSLENIEKILKSIEKYIAIKTWISLATGILVMAWLTILGVNYAVLWGLVAFLLNYIPNIGPFIAVIPPILLSSVDSGMGTAGLVLLGFIVFKLIIDIVEPMFMGRGLSLSILVVFLSLIFWGWLLGPVGMLLATPLTMVLKITCETFDSTRWIAILLGSDPLVIEMIKSRVGVE